MGLRSCILKTATPENLLEISRHNLKYLGCLVGYCRQMGLPLFRISSDVIPFASHPEVNFDWQHLLKNELSELAAEIAGKPYEMPIRVSMHPGQYTVLNSPHAGVVERAKEDLIFHANFLDVLGTPLSNKIVLHVGGAYGEKRAALDRFVGAFQTLPENVKNRIILENDERCFAIDDVLELCATLRIPAIFDVFHHSILHPKTGEMQDWLKKAGKTWGAGDGRQKIHYSQQLVPGKTACTRRILHSGHF